MISCHSSSCRSPGLAFQPSLLASSSLCKSRQNRNANYRRMLKLQCQLPSSCELSNTGRAKGRRIFFVDVHPLCYDGSQPRPSQFIHWIRLLVSRVTQNDPIIAVMDGEKGNEYRRNLLPSYKSKRKRFAPLTSVGRRCNNADIRCALPYIEAFLWECNIPVVKIEDAEADDVVATLVDQVLQRGLKTVIASPDSDFKQLISENVQLVIPIAELGRWSFYTSKHYIQQYDCDPACDLSLRCMLGDESDCIPGLAQIASGFGRKTAVKLLKKHGSLENLLNVAAVQTVGKPYAQDALTKHATFLRRNMQVLSLRRDVAVDLQEDWCCVRDTSYDVAALSKLEGKLKEGILQQDKAICINARVLGHF